MPASLMSWPPLTAAGSAQSRARSPRKDISYAVTRPDMRRFAYRGLYFRALILFGYHFVVFLLLAASIDTFLVFENSFYDAMRISF